MKQEFNLFIVKWLRIKNTQRTFRIPNNRIDPITPQIKQQPMQLCDAHYIVLPEDTLDCWSLLIYLDAG